MQPIPNLPTLFANNLTYERDYRYLFRQLNFSLRPGELLQVQGNNGCGKSTLLRMLAGFIEPHHGSVLWQNRCIFKYRANYQSQLHYLGHLHGTKLNLTVYENLQLISALAQQKLVPQRILQALTRSGLDDQAHTQARHLSAGQLRRLSLARLLLNPVPLWILDEPATALDANGQQLLTELLSSHLINNGIVIIATHQNLQLPASIQTLRLGELHAE